MRRRLEGRTFDRDNPDRYTLLDLRDLAGVRVTVFPKSLLEEVNLKLCGSLSSWTADPVTIGGEVGRCIAHKYCGHVKKVSRNIIAEVQIVPMLIGGFWEVEHSAIYKPTPELRGIADNPDMEDLVIDVYNVLINFEDKFDELVRSYLASLPSPI